MIVRPEGEDDLMKRWAFLLVIMLIIPTVALSSDDIPNVKLLVTVQQKEEGKISKGLHVLELTCWKGNCFLTSVSLNQCMESYLGPKAFYPEVKYSSTFIGDLTVRNENSSLIVQETVLDEVHNFRFDYSLEGKDILWIRRLVGFSGGYVKNDQLLKKISTVEYIPLPKAQVIKLDCGVLFPGINKKK